MRYVIYGGGAVGGVIGARLANAGHEVVMIARGAHLDALLAHGLRVLTPEGELHPQLRAVGSPADVGFESGDVVLLTMKSQDTEAALAELDLVAPSDIPVICAQNGVDNERIALRRRAITLAMCTVLPSTHLEPGVVILHSAPLSGILDLGRYPEGVNEACERVAADLRAATFESRVVARIMRWKHAKLLNNLGNALDAACGPVARQGELYSRARAEGEACYAAAGIDYVSLDEQRTRRAVLAWTQSEGGVHYQGSSSWQSLARGTGTVEADWLNGEIVLLGRLHGVATPVNEVVRRLANRMARDGVPPGSWTIDQVEKDVREFELTSRSEDEPLRR
jgi:2-dehydropantoate 2-reductase